MQLNIILCDDSILKPILDNVSLAKTALIDYDEYFQAMLCFEKLTLQEIEIIINDLLFFTNSFRIELK